MPVLKASPYRPSILPHDLESSRERHDHASLPAIETAREEMDILEIRMCPLIAAEYSRWSGADIHRNEQRTQQAHNDSHYKDLR